jgi:hypothetical protein
MTSEKPSVLTTPIAILIGSAIISGALFLGLRTGTSDAASMHSPAASVMNQPPPAAVPTWKKAPAVDKAKVTKDAVAALDEHREVARRKVRGTGARKETRSSNREISLQHHVRRCGQTRGARSDRRSSDIAARRIGVHQRQLPRHPCAATWTNGFDRRAAGTPVIVRANKDSRGNGCSISPAVRSRRQTLQSRATPWAIPRKAPPRLVHPWQTSRCACRG